MGDRIAEAKERLKKYRAVKTSLVTISQEIKRLELEYQRIRSSRTDGTHVKGGGSGREDALLNNLVKRQELTLALEQAKLWIKATDQAMAVLDEEKQLVLQRIYINPAKGAIGALCKDLKRDRSSIYRRRDEALHTFTIALYGATET